METETETLTSPLVSTPSLLDTIDRVRTETEACGRAANSSFSSIMPNLQIAVDSTSIKAMKKCWRYYYYGFVRGFALPGENVHYIFGIWFHSCTELYEHLRMGTPDKKIYRNLRKIGTPIEIAREAVTAGLDHNMALRCVVRFAVYITWDHRYNRPYSFDEPTKNRYTLLRTVIWYLDRFHDDDFRTVRLQNGRAAVEMSFRFSLNDPEVNNFMAPTGEEYLLCGHLDRLVEWNESLYITDKKTTKYGLDDSYFKQFSPDIQISAYTLAGKVVTRNDVEGLIIEASQVIVTGNRFRRKEISRTQDQLDEFLSDLRFYLSMAYTCAVTDQWPMNEEACGFGNNHCAFRSVCSADPPVRESILKNYYEKRIWDPLQPR